PLWVISGHSNLYSITSSARPRIESGIVNPIFLAVLRLMTRSNFVACSTGRSSGFAPLKILCTKYAARRCIEGRFSPQDIRRFALASAVNCALPVRLPTGVCKAGNQTGVQRINSVRVHDGNGLGRVHDGKGRGRRDHDDYVDIQSNNLSRKLLETLSLTLCI